MTTMATFSLLGIFELHSDVEEEMGAAARQGLSRPWRRRDEDCARLSHRRYADADDQDSLGRSGSSTCEAHDSRQRCDSTDPESRAPEDRVCLGRAPEPKKTAANSSIQQVAELRPGRMQRPPHRLCAHVPRLARFPRQHIGGKAGNAGGLVRISRRRKPYC